MAAELGPGRRVELRAGHGDSFTRIAPPASYYRAMAGQNEQAGANIVVIYSASFTAQARTAFQHAVDIWAATISSPVTIVVEADWTDLNYIDPGILGAAGPYYTVSDWGSCGVPAPPFAGTWYPAALANAIAGSDIDVCLGAPGTPDIFAQFNSGFANWYYGTDGNTPAGQYDFVTVVLHELAHGLGFSGGADVSGGVGSVLDNTYGQPMVYSKSVVNGSGAGILSIPDDTAAMATQLQGGGGGLFWKGANAVAANGGVRPTLFTPNPWQGGSSYSHYDELTYMPGTDGSLMTPYLNSAEAAHNPGSLVVGLFKDIGWAAGDPIDVDVTGNGGDGPLNISKGENLTLNATITNASGQQGDYFLVAVYKGMFWTYKFASKTFVPGQSATFQGPLINLTGKKIYSSTKLPPGKIIFYFAVDENRNNRVDMGSLAFDKLIVRIN